MKRILSSLIALTMVLSVVMPMATQKSYAEFKKRTEIPSYSSEAGKEYYYTDDNVFYKYNLGPNKKYLSGNGGYCVGNCTWYAYGRASEILGRPLNSNFRWSASKWWETNKNGKYYPYGKTPKVGAIACYSSHVAIVEDIVDGKPIVSESGWTISKSKPTSSSKIKFHYGSPWCKNPKGYIYITDVEMPEVKTVDYTVKITAQYLNMRTGPGTEYNAKGYADPGTYKVTEECGDWYKLASNGYWVNKDFAQIVTAETTENTAASSGYKVKITSADLNMRTGPGTDYKSKGCIEPGTYTISKTSNGWGYVAEKKCWVSLKYTTKVTGSSDLKAGNVSATQNTQQPVKYNVKIKASKLNMRTGPATSYKKKGSLKKGAIYEIKETKNGWGKLSKNGYWIKLSYTTKLAPEYKVKVSAKNLNMRTGPATKYKSKGHIKTGTYTIVETNNGWGKLKHNNLWIKLSYTTKL